MSYGDKKVPRQLGHSLSKLLRSLGIETKVKQHEAILNWPKIVGESISNVTAADKVVDGILFIRVSSSVWRNELIYMKQDILERINISVGRKVIREIRFT